MRTLLIFMFYHVLDELILDPDGPTGFILVPDIIERADLERENIGVGDSANIEREFVGVEEEREADVEDIGVQGGDEADVEDVDVQGGDEADVKDIHVEDINLEDFGVEGGDEVDVEDINVEDVNRLTNRGFGDIGKSKATEYSRKLGGDEEYIDSSDCWSEDSEEIDVDVVRGVDLPRRRRSKKTRAYFKKHCKCDIVENNMCETFNSWILTARHKSIITMLEDIRHQLRNRHVDMIKFAETWISDIAPMGRTILEDNKEYSNRCRVLWNGVNGFEIEDGGYTFVVHLDKKYCDYRLWMLRGPHAICAYYYLNVDSDQHVEHWYKKETFLKSYSHFIQLIINMRMWSKTQNPSIEPPKPRKMPDRPGKNRRKKKDKPKKWGKLSKKGVKITCSRCKQVGHNKTVCAKMNGMGSSNSSQPSCQPEASWNPPPPQSSSICGDTSAMARHTYTQTTVPRAPQRKVSSMAGRGQGAAGRGKGTAGRGKNCSSRDGGSGSGQFGADRGGERGIDRGQSAAGRGQGAAGIGEGGICRGQGGSGRGLPRKIDNARGTPFESGKNVSSSQVPPLPTNKRSYNATSFAAAIGYKRLGTGFGVYSDPATGTHVYNPGTSSERVLYGGINLRSASPTNIDISFKPSSLKWNGKDAVTNTQLQQMKANKRKKVEATKSSSSIGSSKK
ncbi:putative TMV resistance protein N-like isoform X1 [Capsicum annuum]|nr:putative TMV resistance protein N-like isoform X1 [Capsicum annuum]